MALTKSSALHYWSSRYGINPRVGGRPVFTRNSSGVFTTQEAEVDTAIVNTPRFDWATLNLPNAQTERRKVLTLEMARTNEQGFSQSFADASWVATSASKTQNVLAPDGSLTAVTVTATAGGGNMQRNVVASSLARRGAIYVRRRTGVGTVQMYDPAGTAVAIAVTSDWQRFASTGAASVNRTSGVVLLTNGDAVDVWGADVEPSTTFETSYTPTPTTAAASRAADNCYWNYLPAGAIQAFMLYLRFVERGTILAGNGSRLLQISSAADADPRFILYNSGTFYTALYGNAASTVSSVLAAAPALGDTVELLFAGFLASGQPVEMIAQSINGAAVSSAGPSGALGLAAFSDTKLWLDSINGTNVGAAGFAECKIVKYADVVGVTAADRMAELRAFELGPNGDVL